MPSCTDQPFIDKAEKELIGSGYFGLSDRDKEEIIRLAEAFTAAEKTETAEDPGK